MIVFKLINFAILVAAIAWAIRKLDLFKFLETRRERIANQISKAQDLKTEAQKLKSKRECELEEAREKQKEIAIEAKRIGQKAKQKLLTEADREAERILKEAHVMAEMEKFRLKKQLRKETIKEIISITSDILKKEISQQDHQRLIYSFLNELEENRHAIGAINF